LYFKSCKLAKYRDRIFAIEEIAAKDFQERGTRNKWVHRQENRKAFGTLSAPRIRPVPVAAFEQLEERRKTGKYFSDLKLVERANETKVPSISNEILRQVFIKEP